MGLFGGKLGGTKPAKDAKKITQSIDYRILRVAWELFVDHRDHHDADDQFKIATPAWLALEIVINNGDLKSFEPHEKKFLGILRRAPEVYTEVIAVLETLKETFSDDDAALVFDSHHDLSDVITPEFQEYRRKEVLNILIEVAKAYKQMLDKFMAKHGSAIDQEIAILEAQEAQRT